MPRLPYTKLTPELMQCLTALSHEVNTGTSLEPGLVALVYLRASILNGCDYCMGLHRAELRKQHEPETRIEAVAAWEGSEAFTPKERAALAWTDAVTRLDGQGIREETYAAALAFFRDKELVELTFAIANINAWNRLGVAFAMEWAPRAKKEGE